MEKALQAIGDTPAISVPLTQAHVSRLPRCERWRPAVIDPGAGVMRVQSGAQGTVEIPVRGHGPAFRLNAHSLRQLVGAVGDVRVVGSAPEAPLVARTGNPRTIVVQMPMRLPKTKG